MKSIVVYDSYFGNTEAIANAVATALAAKGEAKALKADRVSTNDLESVALLVIGSPTRAFKATAKINNFIKGLNAKKHPQLKTAVFDTRVNIKEVDNKFLKFMEQRAGYANDSIVKLLKKKGLAMIGTEQGFFVDESEGPLKEGEILRAEAWAEELARLAE